MGSCSSKNTEPIEEVGESLALKIAFVGVRGHLTGAAKQDGEDKQGEESSPHQTDEKGEDQKEDQGEDQKDQAEGQKGLFVIVKGVGKAGEIHKTQGAEGTCEAVWKEEAEVVHAIGVDLDFAIWEGESYLGAAKLEANTFEPEGFNGELKLEGTEEGAEAYLRLKIGVDGKEYPDGLAPEFNISLTKKKGSPPGVELDSTDGVTIRVSAVSEGPFQDHNESEEAKDKVSPGDFIVRANKAEGDSNKILRELKSASALDLTIRRPEEFSVVLERSDTKKPLGLELKKPAGNELIVARTAKGAIQAWNSSHADREVRKGDRVVAVCGKRGAAADLQRELNSQKLAVLTIVRPASPDSWQFS